MIFFDGVAIVLKLENQGIVLLESVFFFFYGVLLVLQHVLENKGIVFVCLARRNDLFFLIVLVLKHLLENKGFVLEIFVWCGCPCSQTYACE